jgi:signal transduction histidine kinase
MFSKIYAEIGNFEKALIFEKKAQYYDSIYFNESIEKEINLLNIKFTVEKLEAKISQLKKITKQQESQVEKEYFKNRNLSYIIFVIVIIVILLRFTQKFIKKYRNIYNVQNTKLKINNFKLEKIKSNLIEINLSKDRFFNLIAFNLKQPFKILLDYTEKIIKNYDSLTPEEVIKYNELINFTAQDLFELLENLLYWSRLEVGTLTIHIQKHRINEFIEENLSWFKNRISSKGVLLQSFLSEDVLLDFDKNLISLVIRNLISNALSQINQNGIIKISTLKYNNQIEISIENNGQNLSKKPDEILSIKHISENPGKNLGFIISKKIIELHKSKLNILTKDRLGSRYSFKLSLN